MFARGTALATRSSDVPGARVPNPLYNSHTMYSNTLNMSHTLEAGLPERPTTLPASNATLPSSNGLSVGASRAGSLPHGSSPPPWQRLRGQQQQQGESLSTGLPVLHAGGDAGGNVSTSLPLPVPLTAVPAGTAGLNGMNGVGEGEAGGEVASGAVSLGARYCNATMYYVLDSSRPSRPSPAIRWHSGGIESFQDAA